MNYAECLDYLADLGCELRGVKFDLATIRRLLDSLGNPHLRYPTAIVAGTNGKGSTCAMLASILDCAGYRTGLYTSPHLVRVNERIRVGGREISDESFAESFTQVRDAADGLVASGDFPQRPSFFEFLTAAAFLHFARTRVDFAVLEVGMGGRLDATNVTEPRVAAITNVEMDHEQFLGTTRAAIAFEKSGVIRAGRPVISGSDHPEAMGVIRERSRELGADLLELPQAAAISNVRDDDGRFIFDLRLEESLFPDLAPALPGRFQIQNATTAVAAAGRLQQQGFKIPLESIAQGLRKVRWPGRLEAIHTHPLVVLDGAHNPAAAQALAVFVKEEYRGRRLRLVYASMRDKAIEEISEILFPLATEICLTEPLVGRAAAAEEILERARCLPERVFTEPDPVRALEAAISRSSEDDVILVTGSLFLVGAIERALREGKLSFGHAAASPELSTALRPA
ncbi:MAG TPA: folylpolyglutamate synthase/dihydrofolate synthase family protein [Terriglobia bacterium]|nr:folylpolyglutamate synthase/dihydrofolate synthase family protein [Terriglobia bacterium]